MTDHPIGAVSGRNFGTGAVSSHNYKGFEVVKVPHRGSFDNYESFGFPVEWSYTVLDDMGEATLPLIQNSFWTPADAVQAIDAALWLQERVSLRYSDWKASTAYEYNRMMAHRRRFFCVYKALRDIEDVCKESADLDENPRDAVLALINQLGQEVGR